MTEQDRVESSDQIFCAQRSANIVTKGLFCVAKLKKVLKSADETEHFQMIVNSGRNSFDGFNSRICRVDGRCSTMLIAVVSLKEFHQVVQIFAAKKVIFTVESTGVVGGAQSYALLLKYSRLTKSAFKIDLCADLLPAKEHVCMKVNFLRFHLCDVDMRYMIEHHARHLTARIDSPFMQETIDMLKDVLACGFSCQRIGVTLLGQGITQKLASFRLDNHEYFVDPVTYNHINWQFVDQQDQYLDQLSQYQVVVRTVGKKRERVEESVKGDKGSSNRSSSSSSSSKRADSTMEKEIETGTNTAAEMRTYTADYKTEDFLCVADNAVDVGDLDMSSMEKALSSNSSSVSSLTDFYSCGGGRGTKFIAELRRVEE